MMPVEPQRRPGLPRRAKQVQPLPAPGQWPDGRAAAERRRAPKRWPTQQTGDGAEASGAGPQAVACRSESAAFRSLHPHHRWLQPRQQTLGPGSEPEPGPTGRGRAFPGSGKDRRSSAALVGRKEADERRRPRKETPAEPGTRRSQGGLECGKQDLNLHGITTTRPSTWRVCQFRHSRSGTNNRIDGSAATTPANPT